MKEFSFAAAMEAGIRQHVEGLSAQAPVELQPFFKQVGRFEAEFELIIDRAQYTNVDTGAFPAVDCAALVGEDAVWQSIVKAFGAQGGKDISCLTYLWSVQALTERSAQYYSQAAANSAHPAVRLMFSSLAEVKAMLRRRIDGLIRVMVNEIWGDVGFAPFQLGRD